MVVMFNLLKRAAYSHFPKHLMVGNRAGQTHAHPIIIKRAKVVEFILINFNDNCAFFTEDANSLKKLSIELPSKIPLLNSTTVSVPLTKPVAHCLNVGNLETCLFLDFLVCLEIRFTTEEREDVYNFLTNILTC